MSGRRLGIALVPALVALALSLVAPVALGDESPDPRPSPREVEVNLDPASEPLVPYIGALLVTAVGLAMVGFVAMRVNRPRRAHGRPGADWWTCSACATPNAPDRSACFACQAPRVAAEPAPAPPAAAEPLADRAPVPAMPAVDVAPAPALPAGDGASVTGTGPGPGDHAGDPPDGDPQPS